VKDAGDEGLMQYVLSSMYYPEYLPLVFHPGGGGGSKNR
jgi:hypothetical protein